MSSYKTEVQNISYNAANQAFEAIVVLHEAGEAIKYPCSLSFPIDADFEDVAKGLVSVAKSMRSAQRRQLIARAPLQKAPRLVHVKTLARQFADSLGISEASRAA